MTSHILNYSYIYIYIYICMCIKTFAPTLSIAWDLDPISKITLNRYFPCFFVFVFFLFFLTCSHKGNGNWEIDLT
jgi:hypothetical protein